MRKRSWRKFFERLLLAAAIAFVIAVVPLPLWTPEWFLYWQVPAVVFVFICYVGKLLIDTILFPPKE
jgi:NADH:ubiquinone oxidoreductase subunit 2 (subunit N)